MTDGEENISLCFNEYECPDGSIAVRAHTLDGETLSKLEEFMSQEIPTCYISKGEMETRMNETGLSAAEILQNKIPDAGSVMAGDFGEVLTLFYLASERAEAVKKIKKWRFKQDRTKAAPHSDVIIMHRAHTDRPSTNDFVICAEAKLKSTASAFSPIEKAAACSRKGRRPPGSQLSNFMVRF